MSKECFEKGKGQKTQFEDILLDDEQTPLGMWCDDCEIDGVKVKRLLVLNGALREKKTRTISRKAQNEFERLTKGFEKLGANPCKCLDDAQKAVAELTKKVKFCTVDNISYEDVFKNTIGRPKNDGKKEEVLAAVKVHAAVSINKETVDKAIAQEMMYVIVTTALSVTEPWLSC